MKAKSLLAAMMAAALSFNFVSCSDDDDPIPGGGSGIEGNAIVVNVEEPGTFQEEFENITSQNGDYIQGLTTLIIKGKVNQEDMEYLVNHTSTDRIWGSSNLYLDISGIEIVESTYKNELYPANCLYANLPYNILKFPQNLEVFEGNCQGVKDISNLLSDKLKEIGYGAFGDAAFFISENLTIVLPENLERIGDFAFDDVRCFDAADPKESYSIKIDLSKATNLKTIGSYAFNSSRIITDDFVIPEKVDTIGGSAFYDTVKVLHMRPQTPPICGHYRYENWDGHLQYFGTPLYCDTIYVPKGCKDVYLEGAREGEELNILLLCGIECNVILEE